VSGRGGTLRGDAVVREPSARRGTHGGRNNIRK
jgi:hypothetical protein